ncbi:MAG: hypothetical protein Q4G70_01285 [Pseudomonadota bacterium]|nr:hypothetical protein [Pseudomonadota bacterium]
MPRSDHALAFVHACAVLPGTTATVDQWRQEALAEQQADVPGTSTSAMPYRVLTRWQFDEVGQDASAWCTPEAVQAHVRAGARFTWEPKASQAGMAEQAVQGLMRHLGEKPQCSLAVYATSSVDENFFQSSLSRVVCGVGLSRVPHFGVAQWHGASWIGAMHIIDAYGAESASQYGAMLICAEKWPLPTPRVLGWPVVLGDGAAALWIERLQEPPRQAALACVDTLVRGFDPYVTLPGAAQASLPGIDRQRVLADARMLMCELMDQHGLQAHDVQGWLPSGLGLDWDQALQTSLGMAHLQIPLAQQSTREHERDLVDMAWLCAASGPVAIARLLADIQAGQVADGTRYLGWGMSPGGTIGVALLQARSPSA